MTAPASTVYRQATERIMDRRELWITSNSIAANVNFPKKIEYSIVIYCTGLMLLVIIFLIVSLMEII